MKYPTLEKRDLCTVCGEGHMYVIRMPDHLWINYWQQAYENGWPIASVEIALQCEACEVIAIYERSLTEESEEQNHELH